MRSACIARDAQGDRPVATHPSHSSESLLRATHPSPLSESLIRVTFRVTHASHSSESLCEPGQTRRGPHSPRRRPRRAHPALIRVTHVRVALVRVTHLSLRVCAFSRATAITGHQAPRNPAARPGSPPRPAAAGSSSTPRVTHPSH